MELDTIRSLSSERLCLEEWTDLNVSHAAKNLDKKDCPSVYYILFIQRLKCFPICPTELMTLQSIDKLFEKTAHTVECVCNVIVLVSLHSCVCGAIT